MIEAHRPYPYAPNTRESGRRFSSVGVLRRSENTSRPDRYGRTIKRQLNEVPQKREAINSATIVEFKAKKTETDPKKDFFSASWLRDEVNRAKDMPQKPGEAPWYALAGTGFRTKEQASQLIRNTLSPENKPDDKKMEIELAKVGQDVRSFEDEYLKQMLSLRFNLAWQEKDGKKKIVCPDYGNVTWESVTAKNEREGVVHEALFGKKDGKQKGVEEWLNTAPDNSLAVIVSPQGWSGLKDSDNKDIVFTESQIYALRKTPHGLEARTFRFEADINANEKMQRLMGLTVEKATDPKTRIKNTMMNVAYITPSDADKSEKNGLTPVRSFEAVVSIMQESVGGRKTAYGDRKFSEIAEFLQNPDLFTKRHPLTDNLITRLEDYSRLELQSSAAPREKEKNIQIALAITVLQLNKLYRAQEAEKKKSVEPSFRRTQIHTDSGHEVSHGAIIAQLNSGLSYQREKADLQERPGCAGGGSRVNSAGVSREAVSIPSSVSIWGTDQYGNRAYECPSCHATNVREENVLDKACPKCDSTEVAC